MDALEIKTSGQKGCTKLFEHQTFSQKVSILTVPHTPPNYKEEWPIKKKTYNYLSKKKGESLGNGPRVTFHLITH